MTENNVFYLPESMTIYDVASIYNDISLALPERISFQHTREIDGSGVQLIIFVHECLLENGIQLVLCDMSEDVREIIELFNVQITIESKGMH